MSKPSTWFSDEYKYEAFLLWYNSGRPSAQSLHMSIPEAWGGEKPTRRTLNTWITHIFEPQAEKLNAQIAKEIEARTVKEKVEMLSRHALVGGKMQDIGMDYIDKNQDNLTSSSAVRLLVEGIRIERESRGIPQAIEQMVDKSDEDLLEEVMQLIEGSKVEVLEEHGDPE